MKVKLVIVSLLLLFCVKVKAQGEGALQILTINPDPQSLAMGFGGAANVTSAPMGYYYNPALLGFFSQKTNLSYQTYAELPSWMPMLSDVKMFTNSFTVGYKYENVVKDLNISAGFGYARYKVNYRNQIYLFNEENIDKYDAYSLGVSFDYFVNLSFGMSFKNISSQMPYYQRYPVEDIIRINAKANDWGLLLNVPVLKLIDKNLVYKTGTTELKPYVNFALGYSRCNIGGEVYYIDPLQRDPLPLTAHLGYNLSFGTDIKLFDNTFRLVDINFMIDASDILITHDANTGKSSYQSGLGDINITENLLKWKPTDKNPIRKGRSLTLLETVSLLGGSIHGPGYQNGMNTSGVVISSDGLFKVLSSVVFDNDPNAKYIFSHLEMRYVHATVFENDPFVSNISSFAVVIKNLSF